MSNIFFNTCKKFLLLFVYKRVNVDSRYWKSSLKIKVVPKNTVSFDIKSKKIFLVFSKTWQWILDTLCIPQSHWSPKIFKANHHRKYTKVWGYVVFYICCLMWFFWLKRSDHPIFFLTLEITKITKMTVLIVDKMALECTRRPGTVWFMHCIFVISVVVGLIRVKKNVFIALVNILN